MKFSVDELELTPSTKSWPEPLPATRDEGEWRPVHPSTTSSPATPRAPATKETVEQFTWATPKLFPFKPVAPKEIEGILIVHCTDMPLNMQYIRTYVHAYMYTVCKHTYM